MTREDERPHAPDFAPFADDSAAMELGGLSIENGTTRIALHGSIDLTRDRRGLAHARALRDLLAATVAKLEAEAETLPEEVEEATRVAKAVPNPFA